MLLCCKSPYDSDRTVLSIFNANAPVGRLSECAAEVPARSGATAWSVARLLLLTIATRYSDVAAACYFGYLANGNTCS